MKYFLKIDEFRRKMEFLTKLADYESDENILNVRLVVFHDLGWISFLKYYSNFQIQVNTYMPAPLHCNELVLNYKQLCRSRLLRLKNKTTAEPMETNGNVDDIFVIDESD